mgnify:CR=1 FL=1|jgi:hypothetical protein
MDYFVKLRYRRHTRYVEACVTDLYKQISEQAVKYGYIDQSARSRFLKYNEYLVKLKSKN